MTSDERRARLQQIRRHAAIIREAGKTQLSGDAKLISWIVYCDEGEFLLAEIDRLQTENQQSEGLINKLETYGFRCDGGPFTHCVDWITLRAALGIQP